MRAHAFISSAISSAILTQAPPFLLLHRKTERSAFHWKRGARAIALTGNKICWRGLVYRKSCSFTRLTGRGMPQCAYDTRC
jgi:hypothetical protein